MAQMGSEIASALSIALETVNALATTGKIGRKGLRDLREKLELARRVGITGQQVHRLTSGRVRQNPERIDLTSALRDALQQHRREVESRDLSVHQALSPAWVMADPTLLFTLLQSAIDWSLEHTRGPLEFRIEVTSWPVTAILTIGFQFGDDRTSDIGVVRLTGSPLDTMTWRLLEQTASLMELVVRREEAGLRARASIEFPRTVNDPRELLAPKEPDDRGPSTINSKPLAGSHLLVMSGSRETRALVRDAVRHMGLMVDFVTSVDEAREFCLGGMPHAILHETALTGERFEKLRRDLLIDVPTLAFIELTEEGTGYQVRKQAERQFATVPRSAVIEALPSALMFELAHLR